MSPEAFPRRLRAAMLTAAVLLGSAFPVGAFADTAGQLEDAKSRLRSLTDQMQAEKLQYDETDAHLEALKVQVAEAEANYADLEVRLEQTRTAEQVTQAQYEDSQAAVAQMVRDAYKDGPGGVIALLLTAESQSDLVDRLDFLSAVAESNAEDASRANELAANLQDRSQEIQQLLLDKDRILEALNSQKDQLRIAYEQEKEAFDRLQQTLDNVYDLVGQLKKQLKAEDLAYLQNAFQGGQSVPYGQWAELFMAEVGAPACRDNLVVMVAWQLNEGTSAGWNPLATTYSMPGAMTFNSSGVKNYVSVAQGLDATRLTLEKGSSTYRYKPILENLRHCSSAAKTAETVNASSWCRGCSYGRYVTGLISRVEADYNTFAKF